MMSATPVVKGKAKRLLHRLFDSSDPDNPSPPKPPPKPVQQGLDVNSVPNLDLIPAFDALALSGRGNQADPRFVGGFHPHNNFSTGTNTQNYAAASHTPPFKLKMPVPPAMPTPEVSNKVQQSLTMQMALRPPEDEADSPHRYTPPPRPQTVSLVPPAPMTASISAPRPALTRPHTVPPRPQRPRAASTPVTSSRSSTSEQCAGVTKAGKRCSRQVKLGPALSLSYDPGDGDSPPIERFCFQHTKELLVPSGYYSRKTGAWIEFNDWIPGYLCHETQVALRVEMEKARSSSDVHGYIYTFEIRDSDAVETIQLKVGRAVNLVKRIDQWSKQCSSKEQIIRGWYPGTVEADENEQSLMKGRIKAGAKTPWCHRLERLIHLELGDLVATMAYLDPGWPNVYASALKTGAIASVKRTPCADCGKIHKEIFELQRFKRGQLVGKEWDMVVKPVIEKWGQFVANSL